MIFEVALTNLKKGEKLRRPDWGTGFIIMYRPGIVFITPKGLYQAWQPTQEDILAEDWQVVT